MLFLTFLIKINCLQIANQVLFQAILVFCNYYLEIHKSFDCYHPEDVRRVFLDISKALDKVWHEGLIVKLITYGAEGKFIMLLESYLKNQNQRVVLNGLSSS